jgi:hypothetical protein
MKKKTIHKIEKYLIVTFFMSVGLFFLVEAILGGLLSSLLTNLGYAGLFVGYIVGIMAFLLYSFSSFKLKQK